MLKLDRTFLTHLGIIFPVLLFGQGEIMFNNIRLNQSLEEITQTLSVISDSTNVISIDDPRFPLAVSKEDHLVCYHVKTENGIIGKAVFTFADDKLIYIEARGNAYNVFSSIPKDSSSNYLDFQIYENEKLFLKKKEDAVWIMTQEAMHPNLFTWNNPYLNSEKINEVESRFSSKIPKFIKMGAPLEELKPLLKSNSDFITTEELDGTDPNAQFQINCFGVDYLGFPRKIEARFGGGKLNVVWILTGKGEEDRVRKALVNQYGQPIFDNENWEIFNDWQVGLRKDKPEVLLMEKSIGLEYKRSYFKQ